MSLSVNKRALGIVEKLVSEADELKVKAHRLSNGATLIDCGVEAEGSLLAGLYVTRISAADLLEASITTMSYGDPVLPTLQIFSDHPVIACIGAQYGDWEIKIGEFYAIGSGPARALALDRKILSSVAAGKQAYEKMGYTISGPREIYEKIGYYDSSDEAVIVLESQQLPSIGVLAYIAEECGIRPSNLYAIVAQTTSLVGAVQIVGRVVEVGIHKLGLLGFDLMKIITGFGSASTASSRPRQSYGEVNDAIRYGGITSYTVDFDDDDELKKIVNKVPTLALRDYHKPFEEIFRESSDFYEVNLDIFLPAVITVNNMRTGSIFRVGKINVQMLKRILAP